MLEFLNGPCDEEHLDDPVYRRMTDHAAIQTICKVSGCNRVQEIEGCPPERQTEVIRAARKAGISIRQLSRLTGISKARIESVQQ